MLASARALLEELAEDGLDRVETGAAPPPQFPAPVPDADRRADPVAPAPPRRAAAETQLGLDAPAWGPKPTLESVREALGDTPVCHGLLSRST